MFPNSADQIKCVYLPTRYIRAGEKLLSQMYAQREVEVKKENLWKWFHKKFSFKVILKRLG